MDELKESQEQEVYETLEGVKFTLDNLPPNVVVINGVVYEEVETTVGEIEDGDLVFDSDGKPQRQWTLPTKIPNRLFRIWFTDGFSRQYVDCDEEHQWTLVNHNNGSKVELQTDVIYGALNTLKDYRVGNKDGVRIESIEEIPTVDENGNSIEVRCIQLDKSDDHLYQILTNPEEGTEQEPWNVITHNCTMRAAAGRLGAVPSRMLFDNQKATTISSNPGSALLRANSIYFPTQVYFEKDISWLRNWFLERGLSENGFDILAGEVDKSIRPEDIDLGDDDDIELSLEVNKKEIDFEGVHAEIDETRDQKFREV